MQVEDLLEMVSNFPLYDLALRVASQSWTYGIREPDAAAKYLLGVWGVGEIRYRRNTVSGGAIYPVGRHCRIELGRYGAAHYEGLVTACHELGHVFIRSRPDLCYPIEREEEFCEEFGYALASILTLLYTVYCAKYGLKTTY